MSNKKVQKVITYILIALMSYQAFIYPVQRVNAQTIEYSENVETQIQSEQTNAQKTQSALNLTTISSWFKSVVQTQFDLGKITGNAIERLANLYADGTILVQNLTRAVYGIRDGKISEEDIAKLTTAIEQGKYTQSELLGLSSRMQSGALTQEDINRLNSIEIVEHTPVQIGQQIEVVEPVELPFIKSQLIGLENGQIIPTNQVFQFDAGQNVQTYQIDIKRADGTYIYNGNDSNWRTLVTNLPAGEEITVEIWSKKGHLDWESTIYTFQVETPGYIAFLEKLNSIETLDSETKAKLLELYKDGRITHSLLERIANLTANSRVSEFELFAILSKLTENADVNIISKYLELLETSTEFDNLGYAISLLDGDLVINEDGNLQNNQEIVEAEQVEICYLYQEIIQVPRTVTEIKYRVIQQEVKKEQSQLNTDENNYYRNEVRVKAAQKYREIKRYSSSTSIKTSFIAYNASTQPYPTWALQVWKDGNQPWYVIAEQRPAGAYIHIYKTDEIEKWQPAIEDIKRTERAEQYIEESTVYDNAIESTYQPESCNETALEIIPAEIVLPEYVEALNNTNALSNKFIVTDTKNMSHEDSVIYRQLYRDKIKEKFLADKNKIGEWSIDEIETELIAYTSEFYLVEVNRENESETKIYLAEKDGAIRRITAEEANRIIDEYDPNNHIEVQDPSLIRSLDDLPSNDRNRYESVAEQLKAKFRHGDDVTIRLEWFKDVDSIQLRIRDNKSNEWHVYHYNSGSLDFVKTYIDNDVILEKNGIDDLTQSELDRVNEISNRIKQAFSQETGISTSKLVSRLDYYHDNDRFNICLNIEGRTGEYCYKFDGGKYEMEWATTAIPNQQTSTTNRTTSYVSNGTNVLIVDNSTGRVLGDYALPTTGGTNNEAVFYNELGQQVTCTFDDNDQQFCYTLNGDFIESTDKVSLSFLNRDNITIQGLIQRNLIGSALAVAYGPIAYAFTDPTVQKYAMMCILSQNNLDATGWGGGDWIDLGVGFIPYIGNANDVKVAISGYNDITGDEAGCLDRVIRGIFGLPGLAIDIIGTGTAGILSALGSLTFESLEKTALSVGKAILREMGQILTKEFFQEVIVKEIENMVTRVLDNGVYVMGSLITKAKENPIKLFAKDGEFYVKAVGKNYDEITEIAIGDIKIETKFIDASLMSMEKLANATQNLTLPQMQKALDDLVAKTSINQDMVDYILKNWYLKNGDILTFNRAKSMGIELIPTGYKDSKGFTRTVFKGSIDPDYIDPSVGISNLELMKAGKAPYDSVSGTQIQIHHTTQTMDGNWAELPSSCHISNGGKCALHLNVNGKKWGSDIVDSVFNKQRESYWISRALDFN